MSRFLLKSFCLISFLPTIVHAQFVENNSAANNAPTRAGADLFASSTNIIEFLLALVFIASAIGFIISAVKYVIAGGSEKMLETARKTWLSSLVGLIVSVVGYVILNLIKYFLR